MNNLVFAYLYLVAAVGVGFFFVPNVAFQTLNSYLAGWNVPLILPSPLLSPWAFAYSAVLASVLLPPYIFVARHVKEKR